MRAIGVLEPGGPQLSALRLSRALREHGIETAIVAGDASPAGLDLARAHGFEVEHFSEVRNLQWEPCEAFAEWLGERAAGADLVARPHVRRVVGGRPRGARRGAGRRERAQRALLAAHAVRRRRGVGRGAARLLLRPRPGEPRVGGARRRAGRPDRHRRVGDRGPRRPSAGRPADPRITFAGRLAADKGADVLVEAIGMLADPPPTYLLGDGELRAALEHQVAALGLQDVVRFSGWQAQPERFDRRRDSSTSSPRAARRGRRARCSRWGSACPSSQARSRACPRRSPATGARSCRPRSRAPSRRRSARSSSASASPTFDAARVYAQRFTPQRVSARYASVYRSLAGADSAAVRPAA